MSSQIRSSRFRLRQACYLLLPIVVTLALSAEVSPAASDLPTNEQVIAFLTDSIDWYRHCAIERQIATEPADLVFLEDNRSVAAQIVGLSFDFAHADAAVAASLSAGKENVRGPIATGLSPDLAQFVQLENNAELWEQQASQEIAAIQKKLETARGVERRNLQAALDASQSRLDVSQAGLATVREVVEFMHAVAGRETGDLASSIDDLARTVPTVSSPNGAAQEMRNSSTSPAVKPPESGILSLSSEASALGKKVGILDDEIRRTEKLRQTSDDLRKPLLAAINKRVPDVARNYLQVSDLDELQQQKARLDELAALVKALSPAIVASDKQRVLLAAYGSHLKSWRAAVATEDEKTWKNLIRRLVGTIALIVSLVIIGAVVHSVIRRHMRDTERRHVILVTQRVVIWATIVIIVAFALASDITSLATFFGLLAAGLAVALQSFILSAVGYFVLVGKRGIRLGDRVQISGVTGDVIDIGWLQFQLKEIDTRTQRPTGGVVTFSNSIVLASPSTGLSRFNLADVKPATLELSAKVAQ
ncbi:MAG: mechanosensitive ion channel family protein [Acidobacteriaceae bacterium]|nr:mechanosensitive ion channel family protein [Acidobacteriaceae bacterium]